MPFEVHRFEVFPGQSVVVGIFNEKAEARAEAERLSREFKHQSRDEKQDYWWGRNDGDKAVTFLVRTT